MDTEKIKMTPAVKKAFSALQQRVAELEAKKRKPCRCVPATLEAVPAKYLVTGRVTIPHVGIPLPKNVGFHGYVDAEVVSEVVEGKTVMPDRERVQEVLANRADRLFPGHLGVSICDISELPAGW